MLRMSDIYSPPPELVLGREITARVPKADQVRQRQEVEEILIRLRRQPGVILADEVGMGKTFVALAIAYTVAAQSPRGPVLVMVPANLVEKWAQDLRTFCELYLVNKRIVQKGKASPNDLKDPAVVRYDVARHSIELMKLLDDPPRERCHLIFLTHGAMARSQTDKWIRLALIAECLRWHARGGGARLIQVKKQIHRFVGELIWAMGDERAHDLKSELWKQLLAKPADAWKELFNKGVQEEDQLEDDPVPKAVLRALQRRRIDLAPLAEALKKMPVRESSEKLRTSDRLREVRTALRDIEDQLWKELLHQTRWRSPLLVMDEAHHLKNPGTSLARQLRSANFDQLRTGDGAMEKAFDRMLFLTATPFQLGHHELVRVLERFGDVGWGDRQLGERDDFEKRMASLELCLNQSQQAAMALQKSWCQLRPEDCADDTEAWWQRLLDSPSESLTTHQRAVVEAFHAAFRTRDVAQKALQDWIVRHNKGTHWVGTQIVRRSRLAGAAILGQEIPGGMVIPPIQLLPFFLAARSAVDSGKDLLGEALCSSYEAFRSTRANRKAEKDEQEDGEEHTVDLSHSGWYLGEFDRALEHTSGFTHPKVNATVKTVVDLWEAGEKVLVFAFYRLTCRALRIHISDEIERRIMLVGQQRLKEAGHEVDRDDEVEHLIGRIQRRYFDDTDSPGRKAVDSALKEILKSRSESLEKAQVDAEQRDQITDVMRRFLRVPTTLVRYFPIAALDSMDPAEAVARNLGQVDSSGISWHQKFNVFIDFLTESCSKDERELFLDATGHIQTGGIRVENPEEEDVDRATGRVTLANVQVAMGSTPHDKRARLMRAFNTPFFPDILVCSEVMGEGVDLQRFCRHVIHHDLDWNPSAIEQRTGRIDRLGCKAESRHPIVMYLPYLAGTADERQYRVMSDREQWFRVVMGQDEVAKLITPDSHNLMPLPDAATAALSFEFGLDS